MTAQSRDIEEELRKLLEKATPGPWYNVGHGAGGTKIVAGEKPLTIPKSPTVADWNGVPRKEDRALIVAMRNHLPALLSLLSSQREEIERLMGTSPGVAKAMSAFDAGLVKRRAKRARPPVACSPSVNARGEVPPPKFQETFCSQCGGKFGPGDSGYSHCLDHEDDEDGAALHVQDEGEKDGR